MRNEVEINLSAKQLLQLLADAYDEGEVCAVFGKHSYADGDFDEHYGAWRFKRERFSDLPERRRRRQHDFDRWSLAADREDD